MPFNFPKLNSSSNLILFFCSVLPNSDPITGIKINAENKEETNTKLTINGIHFINCPGIPGHKTRGKNAASVVAVDDIIGHIILLYA